MKYRTGFVSNSSSSSFIIAAPRNLLEKSPSEIADVLFEDTWYYYSEDELLKIAAELKRDAKEVTATVFPSYYCSDKDENGKRKGMVPLKYYSDWITSGKTSKEFNENHIFVEISEDKFYQLEDILAVPFIRKRLT